MKNISEQIRSGIKTEICSSGGGHAGGSLSSADILASLYGAVMHYNPRDPQMEERDRFVLSKGHAGLGLYSALAAAGYIPEEELKTFAKTDSRLMNHPDAHATPGIEMSTGSLGHGLGLAVGMALAGQMKRQQHFIYCLVGDGECCEGSIWEAAMTASFRKLKHLVVIVDRNGIGNDGQLNKEVELDPLEDKWRSFGFKTVIVNGHDSEELNHVLLDQKKESDGPYAVIAITEKGHGLREDIAGTGKAHYISGKSEDLQVKFLY